MRAIFLFLLIILCAIPASAQDTVETLLARASQGMREIRSLEAAFRQEKRIPFLDLPLMAKGKLCFHVPQSSSPYIFWEYRDPSSMRGTLSSSGPRAPKRMSRRRKKAF